MPVPPPLAVEDLFHPCGVDDLKVMSSEGLTPFDGVIGQERAVQALEFAIGVAVDGHNVFILGPPGTGRRTFARRAFSEAASKAVAPFDWCYVNNFDDPHCPKALALPAGTAKIFAAEMSQFIEEVQATLSTAFDNEDYRLRHQTIMDQFRQEQTQSLEAVHKEAKQRDIRIMQSPSGMIFAPIRDGEAIGPEEFEKLPEEQQEKIKADVEEITKMLQKAMESTPQRLRKMREQTTELDNQIIALTVDSLIADLISSYESQPKVLEFLESLKLDLIKNSALILASEEQSGPFMPTTPEELTTRRYAVNVVVNADPGGSAPVVFEERPTYAHLIGRVEHRAQMGILSTDFSLIRGGALHRANGGYLIIDAQRILMEPFAWDALKQALKSKCIKIESIEQSFALSSTVALEPEPIPLEVKIALVGDRRLYFLLQQLDPEFTDLFKIAADFDDRMERSVDTQKDMARIMAAIVRQNSLLPISRDGMYRVIEESARDSGHHAKLSTEIRRTEDILREGHYWAERNHHTEISADDIEAAIQSREFRHGRIRERVYEEIKDGNILIDTTGSKAGQINALAVHQLGDYSFGRPSRISARVSLGTGKVIDIERESDLGGSFHSKGILILAGYIAANYGLNQPLSLSATIAFEQSYGGVDGDSASSAELYALLSAIANIPIAQSFAVTGSVNQFGEVQAIGGVNEKIEGFFDVCNASGLTGEQGVLIPTANVKNLMLRRRVIDAVSSDNFRIIAVSTIDEGLSILTGLPAGVANANGDFPSGTLNHLILSALECFALRRREYAKSGKDEDKS